MRAVGHVQLVLGAHPPRLQRIQLGEQLLGIEHHAVAHHAHGALEDARRDLVQDERLSLARVHRVPRIGAALIAHDQIGALGEDIDHLALAFVAPLSANHDNTLDLRSEH